MKKLFLVLLLMLVASAAIAQDGKPKMLPSIDGWNCASVYDEMEETTNKIVLLYSKTHQASVSIAYGELMVNWGQLITVGKADVQIKVGDTEAYFAYGCETSSDGTTTFLSTDVIRKVLRSDSKIVKFRVSPFRGTARLESFDFTGLEKVLDFLEFEL